MNCCQLDPALRPSMKDLLRMLGGERLAIIRAQRAEAVQKLVLGGIAVVGLVAFASALSDAA